MTLKCVHSWEKPEIYLRTFCVFVSCSALKVTLPWGGEYLQFPTLLPQDGRFAKGRIVFDKENHIPIFRGV